MVRTNRCADYINKLMDDSVLGYIDHSRFVSIIAYCRYSDSEVAFEFILFKENEYSEHDFSSNPLELLYQT